MSLRSSLNRQMDVQYSLRYHTGNILVNVLCSINDQELTPSRSSPKPGTTGTDLYSDGASLISAIHFAASSVSIPFEAASSNTCNRFFWID
jgi:hypothetical protein